MTDTPHIHGAASLEIRPLDETNAVAVFQGRTDLSLVAANCQFQRTSDREFAMTCPTGLDGTRIAVVGLAEADTLLAHFGAEGAVLTAATPSGTLRAPTHSPFSGIVLALALVGLAAFLGRPRTLPIPRAVIAYALGGAGVWLLLVSFTGS